MVVSTYAMNAYPLQCLPAVIILGLVLVGLGWAWLVADGCARS